MVLKAANSKNELKGKKRAKCLKKKMLMVKMSQVVKTANSKNELKMYKMS